MNRKKLLPEDFVPAPEQKAVENTIQAGLTYMENHIPAQSPLWMQLKNQVHYLSSYLWTVQFLSLLIMAFLAWRMRHTGNASGEIMLLLASFTAFLGIPELLKGSTYGVLELELSCKYSGVSVFLIRLFLVGTFNTLTIFVSACIFSGTSHTDFGNTLLCGLIPSNVVYFVSFLLFRLFRFHSRISLFVCSLVSGLISCILFSQVLNLYQWNVGLQLAAFFITCGALVAELSYEIRRMTVRKEVGLWNFA